MDEDPKTAGGVGDGVAPIEPAQPKQTVTQENVNSVNPAAPAVAAPAPSSPAGVDAAPTVSVRGATPVSLGGTAPAASTASATTSPDQAPNPDPSQVPNPNRSQHIDHDLKLTGVKKDHKLALTLGILAGVIVLLLGGLATWFFAYYNRPEKVALDAIENLFTAEHVALDGGFIAMGDDDSDLGSIIVNLKSSSRQLPSSTDIDILVTPQDAEDETSINLNLGAVVMDDGVLYVQADGLADSYRSLLRSELLGYEDELTAEEEAAIDQQVASIAELDGEWWQISIADITSFLDVQGDTADFFASVYNCGIAALQSDYGDELAALYKNNPFISITSVKEIKDTADTSMSPTAGHGYYELSFDREKLAAFLSAIPTTVVADEFYTCYNDAAEEYNNNVTDDYEVEPISAESFAEVSPDVIDLPDDVHIYLEISRFGHKLRSVIIIPEISANADLSAASGSVLFTYQAQEAAAPEEYRPASELIEKLSEFMTVTSTGLPENDSTTKPSPTDPDVDDDTGESDDNEDDADYDDLLIIDEEDEV